MAENEAAAPPAKKGKLFIFIALMVILPAGAAGGVYFALSGKSTAAIPKKPTIGPILSLDSFIINLDEKGINRYLKVTLDLELDHATLEESTPFVPRLRDHIILYLSSLSVPLVKKNETKLEIKKKVQAIGDATLGKRALKAVYFKEYVMQ